LVGAGKAVFFDRALLAAMILGFHALSLAVHPIELTEGMALRA
jgi:hypothetical protein